MYAIIKSVINSGNYELTDMLSKIDTMWVQGSITDEQRTELTALARDKATPEATYAPLQEQVDALAVRIDALTRRVAALEDGGRYDGRHARDAGGGVAGVCAANGGARCLQDRRQDYIQRPALHLQDGRLRVDAGCLPGGVGGAGRKHQY